MLVGEGRLQGVEDGHDPSCPAAGSASAAPCWAVDAAMLASTRARSPLAASTHAAAHLAQQPLLRATHRRQRAGPVGAGRGAAPAVGTSASATAPASTSR